ncbi:hypothetical protein ZWY2020_002433 [Hordeum vulgare]|nr:hypothetical protein ZWY2020_002433 [Hordeum vulgare]
MGQLLLLHRGTEDPPPWSLIFPVLVVGGRATVAPLIAGICGSRINEQENLDMLLDMLPDQDNASESLL